MPIDRPNLGPTFREINLNRSAITFAGCTNPQFATDDDPTTAAVFGIPSGTEGVVTTPSPVAIPADAPRASYVYNDNTTLNLFGSNIAIGYYEVVYVGGVMQWGPTADLWNGGVLISDGNGNDVYAMSNVVGDPPYFFGTEDAFEATFGSVAGYTSVSYYHKGGQLGIKNPDDYVLDNNPGYSNPTYALVGPLPFPRYLQYDWTEYLGLVWVGGIRIKQTQSSGPPCLVGISFLSAFGFIENDEEEPPPQVPLGSYTPFPIGDDIYEYIFDYPFPAIGMVYDPDYYAPPSGDDNVVSLYQFQVYENLVYEGELPVPIIGPTPQVQFAVVGCNSLSIYPWVASTGYSSNAYPFTGGMTLAAIQAIDCESKGTIAELRGGESVHQLDAFETFRKKTCRIQIEKADFRLMQFALNGTLIVDAANPSTGAGENQYYTEEYFGSTGLAGYFSVVANSYNGNPQQVMVFAKCKYDTWTYNKATDKITDWELAFTPLWDATYRRQDGKIGGITEITFANGTQPLPPS